MRGDEIRVEGHNAEEVLHVAQELAKGDHANPRLQVPRHLITSRGDRLLAIAPVLVAVGAVIISVSSLRWFGSAIVVIGLSSGIIGFFYASAISLTDSRKHRLMNRLGLLRV
jgi:hypothetical protein